MSQTGEASDLPLGAFAKTVTAYRCRCGHEWVPRVFTDERPRVCPECKSPNWDKPFRWRNK